MYITLLFSSIVMSSSFILVKSTPMSTWMRPVAVISCPHQKFDHAEPWSIVITVYCSEIMLLVIKNDWSFILSRTIVLVMTSFSLDGFCLVILTPITIPAIAPSKKPKLSDMRSVISIGFTFIIIS